MNSRTSAPQDAYPYLRQCLAPQFADVDTESIEAYMDQRFGPGAAEHYDAYLEGFFDDLSRTFQRVAPMVANVAGGVARGAMAGSSLGLPGIIAGAVTGGAGTALSSYTSGPLRDVGNVLNTGTQIASQFSPLGQVGNQVGNAISGLGRVAPQQGAQMPSPPGQAGMGGGAGPMLAGLGSLLGNGGGGAAGQLSSLLGRPEVQQALMALLMGQAGRRTVSVGGAQTPVPTTAIAGLLQNLSAQAVSEAAAWADGAESDLAYMADANGEFVGDPSEDDDRAARVWDLLNNAQLERLAALAMQQPAEPAPPRWSTPRFTDDWRALLTEDLLSGIGEVDGEFDGEDAELDGEDWADATTEWQAEAEYAHL